MSGAMGSMYFNILLISVRVLLSLSDTYSTLMSELHKEIDKCGILHKEGLQDFLCTKLKVTYPMTSSLRVLKLNLCEAHLM